MNENCKMGFTYLVEVVDRHGVASQQEIIHNLMPAEGLTHLLSVAFKGAAQNTAWFLGLFEGSYTPVGTDTAATIVGNATECVAYAEATRVAFTSGSAASGTLDNTAARAEFTLTAGKTVYGGFLTSSPTKGSTTGVLMSVVRFTSPKVLESGSILRVTAGVSFTSI